MFIDSDYILYAGMIQVIERGTGEILENDEHGVFLRDTESNAFMLASDSLECGIEWLKNHEELKYGLMVVFRPELADFIETQYGLEKGLECYPAVYLSADPPRISGKLQIRPAKETDLPVITEHYKKLEDRELREIIRRGELFAGYDNDKMIGFIGQHLEGGMGLLEVFPEYRRKKYGSELESWLIAHMQKQGLIPFCQIEVSNGNSLGLQRKLGLSVSEEKVYWMF